MKLADSGTLSVEPVAQPAAPVRSRSMLVTGGTGALGTAVVKRLLRDGHRVSATWMVEEQADQLRNDVGAGNRLTLIEANVTDASSIGEAVDKATRSHGPVEALVHLVGAWKGGEAVHELSDATWEQMIDVNLRSAFLVSRAVLGSMRDRGFGRLVFVSSRTAREQRAGQGAYAVAKSGVAVLAETIAEENRGLDVTANVVAPSVLDTAANRQSMPDSDFRKWVPLEDVAATTGFLVSDEAGQLRGAWLPVYGSA